MPAAAAEARVRLADAPAPVLFCRACPGVVGLTRLLPYLGEEPSPGGVPGNGAPPAAPPPVAAPPVAPVVPLAPACSPVGRGALAAVVAASTTREVALIRSVATDLP